MIAADSSSLIAYLVQDGGDDTAKIDEAMARRSLRLPPIVLTELLSSPGDKGQLLPFLDSLPAIDLQPGYWERAGHNRRLLRAQGFKAKTADTLIAQCCIDADIPLITRDADFRHFAAHCGLKLA